MKRLALTIIGLFQLMSCATAPETKQQQVSPLQECKSLCAGHHVELFKDDAVECKCAMGVR